MQPGRRFDTESNEKPNLHDASKIRGGKFKPFEGNRRARFQRQSPNRNGRDHAAPWNVTVAIWMPIARI